MSLARVAARSWLAACPAWRLSAPLSARSLHSARPAQSDEGSRDFKKKESAQESEYASREERRTLSEMLARMERDADPDGSKARKALEPILQKHGVKANAQLLGELVSWKQKPAH